MAKSKTMRSWLAVFDGAYWHSIRSWEGKRPPRSPLALCREQLNRRTARTPNGEWAVTRAKCTIEACDGTQIVFELARAAGRI